MMKFLRKVFGADESRPARGDTRVTYWREPGHGTYNFHVQDGNNEVVCQSTQGYVTEEGCLEGIENARQAFSSAVVVRRIVASEDSAL